MSAKGWDALTKKQKSGIQYVTPPPANLYALTEPGGETLLDKTKAFASSVKYTFVLSLMLWWLPILGQCIAGYVGGRRAGSAYRGFLAAMVPVLAFMGISYFIIGDMASLENPGNAMMGSLFSSLSSLLPFIVPYFSFSALYLGDFIGALEETTSLKISIYSVVIVFAFIGGLMSDQTKKEIKTVFKSVTPVKAKQPERVWTKQPPKKSPTRTFDSMKPVKATTKKKSGNASQKKNKKAGTARKSPALK